MEGIAELNHSLLSKLPLTFQSILKSLPLSDYSLLLIGGTAVVVVLSLFVAGSKGSDSGPLEDFGEPEVRKNQKEVKVKILNTKKIEGKEKNIKEVENESPKEEKKEPVVEQSLDDPGWKKVESKKLKKKDE
jgi:hypothetical protein